MVEMWVALTLENLHLLSWIVELLGGFTRPYQSRGPGTVRDFCARCKGFNGKIYRSKCQLRMQYNARATLEGRCVSVLFGVHLKPQ